MGGIAKPLLAAALALLLAAGVAACGSDYSGDSAGAGSATTEQAAPGTTTDETTDEGGSDQPAAGSADEKGSTSFRARGGDNSIPDYGEEADDGEREAASGVVVGFLRARADGDWESVCAAMASSTLKPLEQLAARAAAQYAGKGCTAILETLMRSVPASARASNIGDGIDSLRFEGERAFALYHGTDGKDYFIPLAKEDGEWKVGALAPSEFPGG